MPELGYFSTDRPHPRGELLVKSDDLFPGYYKRPELTAEMFDEDGYYRTGDIVAETGPDQLVYLDRRNNVLKLSQGEFVTVSKLEAVFGDSPLVRQIYVYGNSARPTCSRWSCRPTTRWRLRSPKRCKVVIGESLQDVARAAGLQSYEIPRDFIDRDNAVHARERPADRHPQAGTAEAQGALRRAAGAALRRAGRRPGRRTARHCARAAPTRPVLETVIRAAGALLGAAAADVARRTRSSPISAETRCRR